MEDINVGLITIRKYRYAMQHNVVPTEMVDKDIKFDLTKHSLSSPVMKRTQFRLMLLWACSSQSTEQNLQYRGR